ncbi:11409_t:CDS:1, partial [Paraglomus brasilianum]
NIENLDVKVAERLDDRLNMIEDTVCNEVRELRNEVKEVRNEVKEMREKFDKFEETFENSRRR